MQQELSNFLANKLPLFVIATAAILRVEKDLEEMQYFRKKGANKMEQEGLQSDEEKIMENKQDVLLVISIYAREFKM